MALPKKNINITPQPVQGHYPYGYNGIATPNRRKELADLITENGTFLPKSVLHADLDRGMLDFIIDDVPVVVSGKKIPVIDRILTLQRWGEFSQTWSFSTKDKNVSLPFIVVVRKPDVQYGTNPSLQYTIPNRKQVHFAKVPTWDGNKKGYDIYTIPQPVPVDVTYDVKIVCNRMRELNQFNKVILQKFTSRQAYTYVKGHYIPIVMESIGDESVIDTEERRYYQQNYQFQLQGFLIDEDEFEVTPAVSRTVLLMNGESRNEKIRENNKVKNKINFDSISSATTKTYNYKTNITLARTNNVNTVEFRINNVVLTEPVMVNPGDTVSITIVKTTATASAYIIITETLVR
jgi:hypothetical protein